MTKDILTRFLGTTLYGKLRMKIELEQQWEYAATWQREVSRELSIGPVSCLEDWDLNCNLMPLLKDSL